VRLFYAVELAADVQAVLARLRPNDESRDYRWVDASLLHVTLAFLGEQPAEKLEVLQQVGRAAASASRPARLALGTAGSFGGKRAPRVLWVDLAGDVEALLELQSRLDLALRGAGFALEDRPFRPHITLARRREIAKGGPPPGWPPQLSAAHTTFRMERLTLFQSRLSPRGPTYIPLFEFPLGG
jgi:RNA 2',3'-cyclic 3'-phosphodiesterase